MSELKPCPFCGGKVRLSTASRGASFAVWCGNCGGTAGGEYLSEESAIKHWNRRPLEDEMAEVLEWLLEEFDRRELDGNAVFCGSDMSQVRLVVKKARGEA